MAEKRKGKKKKEEFSTKEEPEKPAKEEYAIASWLRKNVPTKKTKFLNHSVEYFTAVKAVDALMTTHWALPKEGEEPFFPSRIDVIDFMHTMLRHKFFHRAKKVPVSEAELKANQKKKQGKKKASTEETVEKTKKDDTAESSHAETDKAVQPTDEKERRKRKIRLDMHLDQVFVDGTDAYVWIYDPIPVYYWFFGALLVMGAIAICLFPLWPPSVRKGVYYLSLAAAGFLIFIIGLAVLRLVMFCLVWGLTFGAHHLWLFPNLTEDVGFLASFWPLYQYEYKGGSGKKKKKDKDSDNEDEEEGEGDGEKEEGNKTEEDDERTAVDELKPTAGGGGDQSESSESESSSQKSQTGKDFEMIDKDDVES